jgi:DNA-binding MarR family transcriptional regulator
MSNTSGTPGPGPDADLSAGLQHELHKRKPFAHVEEETFLSILRTSGQLANATERFLKAYRLSIATYNILRILRGSSLAGVHEGLTCTQIGADMVTRVPDVTRLVDRLVRGGLVTRHRQRDDKRVVKVKLTARATRLMEKIDAVLPAHHAQHLGHLSRPQHTQLLELLYIARHPPGLA